MDSYLIPTGYERLLPPSVQLTVRARRRALAERARGRILDLGGAESHAALWGRSHTDGPVRLAGTFEADLERLVDEGAQFDTVFSVFRLVAATDLDATLHRLGRLLHPDGRLLFLEPARRTGSSGRAQRLAAPGIAAATGWRTDRDIPSSLRSAALSVTDLERHRTNTVQWWLRCVLEGVAHHALPPGRSRDAPSGE